MNSDGALRAALDLAATDLAHAAEYIAREGGADRVVRSAEVMGAAKRAALASNLEERT